MKSKENIENILLNEKNTTFHNLWDTVKAILRRNFIAVSTNKKNKKYLKQQNLTLNSKL